PISARLARFGGILFDRSDLVQAEMVRVLSRCMTQSSNQSVERTGMSRSAQFQFQRQWRLIPVAHLGRWCLNIAPHYGSNRMELFRALRGRHRSRLTAIARGRFLAR